jgi:hypothetical protein
MIRDSLSRPIAEGSCLSGVGENSADGMSHSFRVPHRNKDSSLAIVHDLRNPAAIGCHDGFTGRHGLNDYLPEGLAFGRGVHNQIQLRQGAIYVAAESGKFHHAFDSQLTRQSADFLIILVFAEQSRADDKEASVRKLPVHQRGRTDKNVLALPGGDSSDQSDVGLVAKFRPVGERGWARTIMHDRELAPEFAARRNY